VTLISNIIEFAKARHYEVTDLVIGRCTGFGGRFLSDLASLLGAPK